MLPDTLGVYYSAVRKDAGRLYAIGPFAKYLDHVAKRFKNVVVMAPTTSETRYDLTYPISAANVRLIELPYFSTTIDALKKRGEIRKRLRASLGEFDFLWARYPMPYGDMLVREATKAGKKVFLQIVGDPLDAVNNTGKYSGLTRYAAIAYARHKEKAMMKALRNIPVFANGGVLYEKFSGHGTKRNVNMVISSTLMEGDYYQRQDTCLKPRIRILYVGYFQPRKGLEYLIRAFEEIRARHGNTELMLIGDGEEKERIEQLAASPSLHGAVTLPGWLPMGEVLNQAYREADIFVFPTIAGEGTPRAILGAMANSLPVIATKTAGIPDVVKDGENGILVEPRSSMAIADAVCKTIEDSGRRKMYIKNGYETARSLSMSGFLDGMIEKAAAFYGDSL